MRKVFTKAEGLRFGHCGGYQIKRLEKNSGFEITVDDRNDGVFIQAVRFKVPNIATYVLVDFSVVQKPQIQYTVTQENCVGFPSGLGVLVEEYELLSSESDLPEDWFKLNKSHK